MKKALSICAMLLMAAIMNVAISEEIEMTYLDAIRLVQLTDASISSFPAVKSDGDTAEIIRYCHNKLALIAAGLRITVPVEQALEDIDIFADETIVTEQTAFTGKYKSDPIFVEDLGYGEGYRIYGSDHYVCLEDTIYDATLTEPVEYVRIETASRNDTDERMVLITRICYADLMTSSNRYLIHADASEVKSIFRRTFSSNTEFQIDLQKWAEGKDYLWDETLLFPRDSI